VIINHKEAEAAWKLLRQWARLSDECWDAEAIVPLEGRNLTEITGAYRAAVKYTHPDRGGKMVDFVAVDRAKHLLAKWLERKPAADTTFRKVNCAPCGGRGRVTIRRGFASMTIVCGRCRGSGDAQYEPDVTGE
jgi:hypothetical protein